jgi:hypothetical protein
LKFINGIFIKSLCFFFIFYFILQLDSAAQGKDGSASDIMPAAKQQLSFIDLQRMISWFNVPFNYNTHHPVRSLQIQRLLCTLQGEQLQKCTQEAYEAYWVKQIDISNELFINGNENNKIWLLIILFQLYNHMYNLYGFCICILFFF